MWQALGSELQDPRPFPSIGDLLESIDIAQLLDQLHNSNAGALHSNTDGLSIHEKLRFDVSLHATDPGNDLSLCHLYLQDFSDFDARRRQ